MNNNPTYQQPLCSHCATCDESNTTTTRKRDENETRTTASDTVRCVPQLRFPEFQNTGEWEECCVKDICKIETGKSNTQDQSSKGKYPFYIRSNKPVRSDKYLYDCEAVITIGEGNIGRVFHYVNGKFDLHQRCYKMTNFKKVSGKYFYYYFSANFYKRAMALSAKATVDSVRLEMIAEMKICYPTIREQQKIVSCLQTIDNHISSATEKLEQLQMHKKALLQKLFPQRGKTIPELRFPEFQGEGNWIAKRMGEIIKVNSGRDYKHLKHGDIPVFGTGGYMLSVDDFLSEVDAVGIGRKGTIDKPQYLKAPFWTVDTLFFLTSNEGYDTKYLYYLSQTIPWKKYGEQTGVPSLSKIAIENLDIMVSPNINEQKKIANVLSALDKSEEMLSNKILLLRQHKESLMQKLFVRL